MEEFLEVVKRLNTPEKVAKYLRNNMSWKNTDGWGLSVKEFFEVKIGDCKEWTNFTVYCLEKHGYNAKSLCVNLDGSGAHRICMYSEDGQIFAIDNGNLRGPFYSREELIGYTQLFHSKRRD